MGIGEKRLLSGELHACKQFQLDGPLVCGVIVTQLGERTYISHVECLEIPRMKELVTI